MNVANSTSSETSYESHWYVSVQLLLEKNELNISCAYIITHHTLPHWYLLSHIRFLSKYFQDSRSKSMNSIGTSAITISFLTFKYKLCKTISAVERSQGGKEISPRTLDTSLMATKTMIPYFVFGRVYFCCSTLSHFFAICHKFHANLVSKNIRYGIYICNPG